MNSWIRLTGVVAAAVAFGLLSAPASRAEDTAALWTKHCASCHGADGKGDTKSGRALKVRDLTAADVHAGLERAKVRDTIERGITKQETGKVVMKGFANKLSPAEMDALAGHVMSLGSGR